MIQILECSAITYPKNLQGCSSRAELDGGREREHGSLRQRRHRESLDDGHFVGLNLRFVIFEFSGLQLNSLNHRADIHKAQNPPRVFALIAEQTLLGDSLSWNRIHNLPLVVLGRIYVLANLSRASSVWHR